MSNYQIFKADIISWLEWYENEIQEGRELPFHGVLSDPPYFLDTIVKRFGKKTSAPAKHGTDGVFARSSDKFLGKTWDSFENPQHYQQWVTTWAKLLKKVLYPGAVALFYGGSRTYHRLAAGIEDAGWEIEDDISVMSWIYGSGMPHGYNYAKGMAKSKKEEMREQAKNWNGYNTAIKPAHEPILVARVPRDKYSYAECATLFGTGGLNIKDTSLPVKGSEKSRYPANIILMHHPECTDDSCHPECHLVQLDSTTGNRKAGGTVSGKEPSAVQKFIYNGYGRVPWSSHGDSGGASRFFYAAKPATWERNWGLSENSKHPTMKSIMLNEYLSKMILMPESVGERRLIVPFSGLGSEMIGGILAGWTKVIGIERDDDDEYIIQAEQRLKKWSEFSSYKDASSFYKNSLKNKKEKTG